MKKLIDYILEESLKSISIIGLAKNCGKTVTFNTLVKEATEKNLRLGLLSYGRDGEETDILNRHEKPRIFIPPQTIFITTDKALEKSSLTANLIINTGINTTLGAINIYQSCAEGGNVELVGINTLSRLKKVTELIKDKIGLLLLDGALDRRSSAIPDLTEGVILASGAVIGNSEELVVKRTVAEINKLTLPEFRDLKIRDIIKQAEPGKSGIIYDDNLDCFLSETTFEAINELRASGNISGKTIYLHGALTDSFAEELCYLPGVNNCDITVQNATKIFLNQRSINLLNKKHIKLYVLSRINLLAVTINPVSPYGVKLNSKTLINLLKQELEKIPVYDLMSKDYVSE